jgi:hypothetical protein
VAAPPEQQTSAADTQATQVALDEFVEVATRAASRAIEVRGSGVRVTPRSSQPSASDSAALAGIRIIIGVVLEAGSPS